MTLDWQTIAVVTCVAWAAAVVARRGWRLVRAGKGTSDVSPCSGCGGGCGTEVVRLEVAAGDAQRDRA